MKEFVNVLENAGYKDQEDMFLCGYDWRKVPFGDTEDFLKLNLPFNHFGKFFLDMKKIITNAKANTNKKVFLVAHSMGAMVTNLFINVARNFEGKGIEENWVDNNIAGFIPVGPAWDGSPKSLRGILSGANPMGPYGFDLAFRDLERNMMGSLALISMTKEAYKDNIGILLKDKKLKKIYQYGITNDLNSIVKIMEKIGPDFEDGLNIYKNIIKTKILSLKDPKVPVYLLYGKTIQTEAGGYEYEVSNEEDIFVDNISMYFDMGDGTVPVGVLEFPLTDHEYEFNGEKIQIPTWTDLRESLILTGKDGEHLNIMVNCPQAFNFILNIIS